MTTPHQKKERAGDSDRQAVKQTTSFDHEFANEPLTEMERQNNKKRKKNQ